MSQLDTDRVHQRLTRNSISNVLRFALLIVITFFLTPFIVRTLGDSVYGFWVILMSFLGYASILEMGVQPAVVKLVGQHRAVGATDRLRELVTAALVFFLTVGAIVVLVCVTVLPFIVTRYVGGLDGFEHPRWLYVLIALDATIMYLNYLVTGILYGCQRYHVKNVIDVLGWFVNVVLIVLLLERGGILGLIIAKTGMDLFVVLTSAVMVPRVFPELAISLRSLRRRSFHDLMSFGGRVFLSATTTRLAAYAEPLIISTALGAAAAAFYAIPVKLIDYVRQISWTLTASFMPMFSELESRRDQDALRTVYLNYSRYIFTLILPLPILLFVYGPQFLGLWIGPEYATVGEIALYLLTAAVLIESFQPLTWRFFVGVGHLNILVLVSALFSLLTIVSSIVLVRIFGISGVALSQLAGAVLGQSMYLLHASRYLGVPWPTILARVNLPPLAVGAVVYLVARLTRATLGADGYPAMLAGTAICLAVHVILSTFVAITRSERAAIRFRLAGMRSGH